MSTPLTSAYVAPSGDNQTGYVVFPDVRVAPQEGDRLYAMRGTVLLVVVRDGKRIGWTVPLK